MASILKHQLGVNFNEVIGNELEMKEQYYTKKIIFKPGKLGLRYQEYVVTKVKPNGQADLNDVKKGWRIVEVNGAKVSSNAIEITEAIDRTYNCRQPTDIMFCVRRRRRNEVDFIFEAHTQNPWGYAVNFEDHWATWCITRICSKQQAKKLGVRMGDKLIMVDGKLLNNDNYLSIKELLLDGRPSTQKFLRRDTEIDFIFEAHSKKPWGYAINFIEHWSHWRITMVRPGQQAKRLGVMVGDKVFMVDGKLLNDDNYSSIKQLLSDGRPCKQTFLRREKEVHFVFEDHSKKPWGIAINFEAHWSTWHVTMIRSRQQADRLGVRMEDITN